MVGSQFDSDGGPGHGAVWILLLNTDGTVKAHQKISDNEGEFTEVFNNHRYFGASVAPLGDIDLDGVVDLAVGAQGNQDAQANGRGCVYLLYLNRDGTVKAHAKISDTSGGFTTGLLDDIDNFGRSLAYLGDVDGDGQGLTQCTAHAVHLPSAHCWPCAPCVAHRHLTPSLAALAAQETALSTWRWARMIRATAASTAARCGSSF